MFIINFNRLRQNNSPYEKNILDFRYTLRNIAKKFQICKGYNCKRLFP